MQLAAAQVVLADRAFPVAQQHPRARAQPVREIAPVGAQGPPRCGSGPVRAADTSWSDDDQVPVPCTSHSTGRHGRIERDEPAVVADRKGKQIEVGHLFWPMNPGAVEHGIIEQADVAGPELMMRGNAGLTQQRERLRRRYGTWIARLADDPDKAVLRHWTRRPSVHDLRVKPLPGPAVVNMVCVDERQQDVDVEEGAAHSPSSSRSRSINAFVTASPRGDSVGKLKRPDSTSAGAVKPCRATSERTAPADLFSRRALSFTASRTSSSMSRVVRMNLMLAHHGSHPSPDVLTGSPLPSQCDRRAVTCSFVVTMPEICARVEARLGVLVARTCAGDSAGHCEVPRAAGCRSGGCGGGVAVAGRGGEGEVDRVSLLAGGGERRSGWPRQGRRIRLDYVEILTDDIELIAPEVGAA
jgi:hypothetical protein